MRGKYAPLYRRLAANCGEEWYVSFAEIEEILGFRLPNSAYLYPAWWSNGGPSQALAWRAAGWRAHSVDVEEETLVFARTELAPVGERPRKRRFDVRRDWPPIPGGDWSPDFTVGREQIYDESGRLTGGPQDGPESNLRRDRSDPRVSVASLGAATSPLVGEWRTHSVDLGDETPVFGRTALARPNPGSEDLTGE